MDGRGGEAGGSTPPTTRTVAPSDRASDRLNLPSLTSERRAVVTHNPPDPIEFRAGSARYENTPAAIATHHSVHLDAPLVHVARQRGACRNPIIIGDFDCPRSHRTTLVRTPGCPDKRVGAA